MSRRVPLRTCVACRRSRPKTELLRLVRPAMSSGSEVCFDPSGSAPGRGAYVCPEAACVEMATQKGAQRLRDSLRGASAINADAALLAAAQTINLPQPT